MVFKKIPNFGRPEMSTGLLQLEVTWYKIRICTSYIGEQRNVPDSKIKHN